MRPRPADLLALVVLAALLLGCFARLALAPRGLIVDGDRPSIDYTQREDPRHVGNDVTFVYLPRFLHVSQALKQSGRLPGWDARGFGGRPLVGNPQGGLFYPPVWLAWLWRSPSLPGWLTVGHLFWGGLGVYVLTRGLGLGRWGATVAAGCYEASPYLLAQTFEGHYPHVWAASWYPWTFWAYLELRRGRRWAGLALPPMLALGFLTGHPQETYYLVFALGVWTLADSGALLRAGAWHRALMGLVLWTGLLVLTLGLVAIELVPDTAAQQWTLRTTRMTLRQASRYHLHSINLFQLLGPEALGGPADYFGEDNYWETLLAFGLVPLVLGAVALARHPDRAVVKSWAALALLAVGFAAGHRLGVFPVLFRLVPGMDRFRVPARSLFLANLGAAVLSGLGIDALRRLAAEDWRRVEQAFRFAGLTVVAALLVVRGLGGAFDVDSTPSRPAFDEIRFGQAWEAPKDPAEHRVARAADRLLSSGMFWLATMGTGALLLLGRSGLLPAARRGAVAASLLGGLAVVELGWYGHRLLEVAPAERFLDADPISTALKTAEPQTSGPVRIRARDVLYPDARAFANGIEKININDGFQLQHAADLYQTLYPLLYRQSPPDADEPMGEAVAEFERAVRQGILDRLSVAFLVSDHIEPEPTWPLIATGVWDGKSFAIHRNPTALPRAYVVPRAHEAPDDAAAVVGLFARVDPRQAVVMPSDPLGESQTGPRQPFTPASWRSSRPDRIDLDVAPPAPGLLVVAATWMPGWSAVVDGRATVILRGNHAQRVVPLPTPGRHSIVLRYDAPGRTQGLAVTTLATLTWIAAGLVLWVRGSSQPRSHPAVSLAEPPLEHEHSREEEEERPVVPDPVLGLAHKLGDRLAFE
jgi:hypothetical protein